MTTSTSAKATKLSREDIIFQTAVIIAEQGLQQLTMRSLAKRLNCSVGTLPHYFSGKGEIVEAALNWSSERIIKRVANVDVSEASIDTFIPIIKSTLPFDKQADLEWRVRLALWNYASSNNAMRKAVREMSDIGIELLSSWAKILQDKGELKASLDINDVAHTIYNLVNGFAFNLLHIPMAQRHAQMDHLINYINNLKS